MEDKRLLCVGVAWIELHSFHVPSVSNRKGQLHGRRRRGGSCRRERNANILLVFRLGDIDFDALFADGYDAQHATKSTPNESRHLLVSQGVWQLARGVADDVPGGEHRVHGRGRVGDGAHVVSHGQRRMDLDGGGFGAGSADVDALPRHVDPLLAARQRDGHPQGLARRHLARGRRVAVGPPPDELPRQHHHNRPPRRTPRLPLPLPRGRQVGGRRRLHQRAACAQQPQDMTGFGSCGQV
mmetsp:Transcript_33479/g.67009  ORF Transcript_33479/g.67009 Transcript_33479/m.67009 type:complete len:240 (+) Transcript_33479:570-1289(+)